MSMIKRVRKIKTNPVLLGISFTTKEAERFNISEGDMIFVDFGKFVRASELKEVE